MSPTSPNIFRVRHQLREVNEKAYDPEVLAIGPYHHRNDKFKFMEDQKKRCLEQLKGRNEGSIDRYKLTLRKLEQRARNCYEKINFSQEGDDFLMMMLTDGYFIVELFRKVISRESIDEDGPVMHVRRIGTNITRELLLLENQIPLFVLSELYDLTKGPDEDDDFSDVANKFFNLLGESEGEGEHESLREGLSDAAVRFIKFVLGESEGEGEHESQGEGESQGEHLLHLYHMWRTSDLPETDPQDCIVVMPSATGKDWIPSATELRESGVSFKAAQGNGPSGFKFENGTLEIPILRVHDETESRLRNLVAYEQHRQSEGINYFTDYVAFMDCLINTSNDVKMLRRKGIIKNYLGDDEVIAQMFNKIGDHVFIYKSYYSGIFRKVNAYHAKPWNTWMAKLRRDYFHSPWAIFSVLAAIVLLFLTIAQTVVSILSYIKQS
ncbi:hypothetical protein BT93_H1424 [Corymbia citriodora subsp. variegata]|nr:hypothetical protein BT93_H1424 [Corymbia citriodora subsp. variegata]